MGGICIVESPTSPCLEHSNIVQGGISQVSMFVLCSNLLLRVWYTVPSHGCIVVLLFVLLVRLWAELHTAAKAFVEKLNCEISTHHKKLSLHTLLRSCAISSLISFCIGDWVSPLGQLMACPTERLIANFHNCFGQVHVPFELCRDTMTTPLSVPQRGQPVTQLCVVHPDHKCRLAHNSADDCTWQLLNGAMLLVTFCPQWLILTGFPSCATPQMGEVRTSHWFSEPLSRLRHSFVHRVHLHSANVSVQSCILLRIIIHTTPQGEWRKAAWQTALDINRVWWFTFAHLWTSKPLQRTNQLASTFPVHKMPRQAYSRRFFCHAEENVAAFLDKVMTTGRVSLWLLNGSKSNWPATYWKTYGSDSYVRQPAVEEKVEMEGFKL